MAFNERRFFLRTILSAAAAGLSYLFFNMLEIRNTFAGNKGKTIEIDSELQDGVSVFDKLIVVKNNSSIKIFSSKCTHLGCRLNSEDGENIICPCHGSKFSLFGQVTEGPATRNLTELKYKLSGRKIIITLNDES